eukprot:sb/3465703/
MVANDTLGTDLLGSVDKRTSDMTGVPVRSVQRFRRHWKDNELTPKVIKGKQRIEMASWVGSYIRLIVTQMYGYVGGSTQDREYPSCRRIIEKFYEAFSDFPKYSEVVWRRWIKLSGLEFGKLKDRATTVARKNASLDLMTYLSKLYQYRREGRKIYYTDETWFNKNHVRSHGWKLEDGDEGMADVPHGEGKRLIITHIMSDDGLVDGAADVFVGVKNSKGDYHHEMNGEHYEKWMKEKVLPRLEPNSVVVIDKASYHSRYTEDSLQSSKPKEKGWTLEQIVEWLINRRESEGETVTEADKDRYSAMGICQLVSLCDKYPVVKKYRIDEILQVKGIKVLRLPTRMCELNPIEMVWAYVKGWLTSTNVGKSKLEDLVEKV